MSEERVKELRDKIARLYDGHRTPTDAEKKELDKIHAELGRLLTEHGLVKESLTAQEVRT